VLAFSAHAQQWPHKPIKVIVPFPPGGVTDSVARIAADWLTQRLGQPVVADNRPGASGAIAAELVARAEPDGYTLLAAAAPQLAIVPHVQKISYDPIKDFAPISSSHQSLRARLQREARRGQPEAARRPRARPTRPAQLRLARLRTVGHLTMELWLARAA